MLFECIFAIFFKVEPKISGTSANLRFCNFYYFLSKFFSFFQFVSEFSDRYIIWFSNLLDLFLHFG